MMMMIMVIITIMMKLRKILVEVETEEDYKSKGFLQNYTCIFLTIILMIITTLINK